MLVLREKAWAKISTQTSSPILLPQASANPNPMDFWGPVLNVCEAVRQNDSRALVRFYLEHETRGKIYFSEVYQPVDFLPAPADGSLAGYTARLVDELRGQRFGLVMNNIHLYDDDTWRATWPFLERVFKLRGPAFGGVTLELFLGNYRRTPFGIHKDDQDVFTFVLDGKSASAFGRWNDSRIGRRSRKSRGNSSADGWRMSR